MEPSIKDLHLTKADGLLRLYYTVSVQSLTVKFC
jgi:hypothetical protein